MPAAGTNNATYSAWDITLGEEGDLSLLTCEVDALSTFDCFVTEKTKGGVASKKKQTVVTKITEHFWVFEVQWELVVFQGTDHTAESRVVVASRTGHCALKTSGDRANTPKPETHVHAPFDVEITWLLQNLTAELQLAFAIESHILAPMKIYETAVHHKNTELTKAISQVQLQFGVDTAQTKIFVSAFGSDGQKIGKRDAPSHLTKQQPGR